MHYIFYVKNYLLNRIVVGFRKTRDPSLAPTRSERVPMKRVNEEKREARERERPRKNKQRHHNSHNTSFN